MDHFPKSNESRGALIQDGRGGVQTYMAQVYGWMASGLFLTAFVAWATLRTPALLSMVLFSKVTFVGLILVQLGVVVVLSARLHKLSAGMATSLFMLYSALTGVTLSSVFLVYTESSVASAFVISAGMFALVSLYGFATRRDLSGLGSLMFMGLIGILLATLVNFWLQSAALSWTVSYIGVVVFVGLTAYDTQKLKNLASQIDVGDAVGLRRYAIMGALNLYLDFINLFLMLLRIMGNRR